jgi:tetratricopeptide (TPR) repeat protein
MTNSQSQARLDRLLAYLSSDPQNDHLRADVFQAALETGRLDLADAEVSRALVERPDDPVWQHRQTSLLLAERKYEEARDALQALLTTGVSDPAVVHDLAFALFRLGQTEEAARTVQPLLTLPEDRTGLAWGLWLRCQHRLERTGEALKAFRARFAAEGASADAVGVASLMAVDAGQLADADRWSAAALQQLPTQLEALVARGTLAFGAGALQEAMTCFERALALSPRDGRTWSSVAMAQMAALDLPRADEAFGRALETMPDHTGTWIARGWCQLFLNKFEEAQRSFQEAVNRDRNLSEGHGGLAVALARLGDAGQAEREIEIALRLDPKGLGARYAEAVLAGKAENPETVRGLSVMAARAARMG